jgi:hypothetical protein
MKNYDICWGDIFHFNIAISHICIIQKINIKILLIKLYYIF